MLSKHRLRLRQIAVDQKAIVSNKRLRNRIHTGKHKQAHILSLFIKQHCISMHVLIQTYKQATIFILVVIANGLCLVNCHDNIKKELDWH